MTLFLKFDKQETDVSILETHDFAYGPCSRSYFILTKAVERRFIEPLQEKCAWNKFTLLRTLPAGEGIISWITYQMFSIPKFCMIATG
jgi:hypothetical protein